LSPTEFRRVLSGIRAAQSSEGIYYLYNFVPNNFKERDLDLKIA
jgi:hypothetical protein